MRLNKFSLKRGQRLRCRKTTAPAMTVGQLISYLLAIFLGSLLGSGVYGVLPSQASPALQELTPAQGQTTLLAQRESIPAGRFVSTAVEPVGKAVVRVDIERTVTFSNPFGGLFGNESFSNMPRQRRLRGQGSGLIVDSSGIILTNAHVVSEADQVSVHLKDGRTFPGKVQGADSVTDLAVIKVEGTELPTAPIGDSSAVQVGDWAIAVGNPLGLDNTVTLGIVSSLERPSAEVGIPDKRVNFIQTDAAINPGNSGGPLLNDRGEVIGINTAIRADAAAGGIGFAIPVNKAKAIYPKLAQGERIAHPYLGILMQNLTPELAAEYNSAPNSSVQLPKVNGVLVAQVQPNTPAENFGMRPGDVVVKVDGQSVADPGQLQRIVENSRVGQKLEFQVRRGNQTKSLAVRTGELQDFS